MRLLAILLLEVLEQNREFTNLQEYMILLYWFIQFHYPSQVTTYSQKKNVSVTKSSNSSH